MADFKGESVLGFYIFNSSIDRWLSDDEHSWGDFADAAEFTNEEVARGIMEREEGSGTCYLMVALH